MSDALESAILKTLAGPMQSGDFDATLPDRIATALVPDDVISKAYGKAHKSRAAKLALAQAGQMITGIDETKQRVIGLMVARSISESWTQRELYNRLKDVVGLSPRDAQAVENLRDGLKRQGFTPSKIDARAKAYAGRLLRRRAKLIANNERAMVLARAEADGWLRDQQNDKINPAAMRQTIAQRGCCTRCQQEDQTTHRLDEHSHLPPFHPGCRCKSVLVGADTPWETVPVETEPIIKSVVRTPGGRVGNDSPFSRSKSSNWVARGGGLPKYVRVVARGLMKDGRTESQAIGMAIGIIKNWAAGKGGVSPKVRAAAVKALAEWTALKAKSKAKDVSKAFYEGLTSPEHIDSGLLAPDITNEVVRLFLESIKIGDYIDFIQYVRTPDGQINTRTGWGHYRGIVMRGERMYVKIETGHGETKETVTVPARRVRTPDKIERVVEDPDAL